MNMDINCISIFKQLSFPVKFKYVEFAGRGSLFTICEESVRVQQLV